MAVEKKIYQAIIDDLKLGNPVAEFDSILDEARVDTPVFQGFLNDRYDVVTGQKGAGKTAIFKIVTQYLNSYFLLQQNVVLLSGVNSSGEAIFKEFEDRFEKFSEQDFENFWKLYFINLIYNRFIKDPTYAPKLKGCSSEIDEFKAACAKAGLPDIPSQQKLADIIRWVMQRFGKIGKAKVTLGTDPNNPQIVLAGLELERKEDNSSPDEDITSIYVNEIGEALNKILKKSGYKLWVVLDRLDEVFQRYTSVEFNGLRGLLKAYRSFSGTDKVDLFKVKIFLRDDIMDFLTGNKAFQNYYPQKDLPPLPAATHMLAKASPVLRWTEDEIEKLILNRLLLSTKLREFIGISSGDAKKINELLKTKKQRLYYWNKIFPEKISRSPSLKWIHSHLRDSNLVVTPRSVIDMLQAATDYQKKELQLDFKDSQHIFPIEAIKAGITEASKSKLKNDIYNEFPKEKINIEKLRDSGKTRFSKADMRKLYGKNWIYVIDTLRRIGILRFLKTADEYRIVFLYRPALGTTYQFG